MGIQDSRIDPERLRSESFYDCVDIGASGFASSWPGTIGPGTSSVRLFGNSNIGNLELSNLQIPGSMPGTWTFIVQRWYARNNFPEASPAQRDRVKAWANSVSVSFVIGHRPTWTRSLYELFTRMPRTVEDDVLPRAPADPFPVVIPPRQSFSASLDQFGSNIDMLSGLLRAGQAETYRPRVWIHLEGVIVDSDATEPHAKSVISMILNAGKTADTVEDQITQWLGAKIEGADPLVQGTLDAIRDGILEGRHRS